MENENKISEKTEIWFEGFSEFVLEPLKDPDLREKLEKIKPKYLGVADPIDG